MTDIARKAPPGAKAIPGYRERKWMQEIDRIHVELLELAKEMASKQDKPIRKALANLRRMRIDLEIAVNHAERDQ
jgi:hypothetical protein